MSDQLTLSTRHTEDGVPVLVAAGEIDMSNAEVFRQGLDAAGADDGLVVDLSEVSYLDSAGLAALFAKAVRTRMEIVAGDHLQHLLTVSGLASLVSLR